MTFYRISGQDIYLPYLIPDLAFQETGDTQRSKPDISSLPDFSLSMSCNTIGWVGGKQREVETWSASPGILLKVAGGSDFYIAPDGQYIVKTERDGNELSSSLTELDRDILLGPALVLALALRGTWCLHASAAIHNDNLIVFLGESGQGKSTLASSLVAAERSGWRLVADDILPVTMDSGGVAAWPRFPQLKLPLEAQPGPGLPERLLISKVCVLANAGMDEKPELQRLPAGQSAQVLLGHVAGTRLFDPELLEKHLTFCTRAAGQVPVFRLSYPRRLDALPSVKELLEKPC